MSRQREVRNKALKVLQDLEILMLNGHFDYGNGYHGRVYLNPHQLFQQPSTIWRFAQDLIDVLPEDMISKTQIVAGPVTGGALLAHTIAGLRDGRRSLTHPPCSFAPFNFDPVEGLTLRSFYASRMSGKQVLLADDVRNTGKTFEQCATLVHGAGGSVIGTVEIFDRLEVITSLEVPNTALAEYRAPENYPVAECPQCVTGEPITTF